MARKSKYNVNSIKITEAIWSVGLYIRLSKADGDNEESDSVENQRDTLSNIIQENEDMKIYDYYIDDGYTGGNFERPGFQRMMKDIKNKKVNCVMAKDLSRIGRDYIETGKYIERIFPSYNTRVICIDDSIDSYANPESVSGIMVPFKNIINDAYLQDISKKVKSSLNTKRKMGKFIGSAPPYGYVKKEEDRNQLVIDEEAAKIVRYIFKLYVEGYSKVGIAKKLNQENVPCPSEYKRLKGSNYKNGNKLKQTTYWGYPTIHKILNSEMYIGNMVQGLYRNKNYKSKAKESLDRSKWIIVEDTHEPIIDMNTWSKVQDLLNRNTRQMRKSKKVNIFSGFLKCPDCGRNLNLTKGRKKYTFKCNSYKMYGKDICNPHTIPEEEIYDIVLNDIQNEAKLALKVDEIVEIMNKKNDNTFQRKRLNIEINKLEQEKQKIFKLKKCIYEDWKLGDLAKNDYIAFKEDYESREKEIERKLDELRNERNEEEVKIDNHNSWLVTFKKYGKLEKLDRDIITELINFIYVYNDGSVEIHYKFKSEFIELYYHITDESLNTRSMGRVQRTGR